MVRAALRFSDATTMTALAVAVGNLILLTEHVAATTRDGSRARHEAEMALISLRNLQREITLWEDARAGELKAQERPALRVVK